MAMVSSEIIRSSPIKKLTFRRHEQIAFTIDAICASPLVKHYIIGVTARQGIRRADEHRKLGFEHFVILVDQLPVSEALWLEEVLQGYIVHNETMSVYKKYDPSRRGARHYPNASASKKSPDSPINSVYMAWTET